MQQELIFKHALFRKAHLLDYYNEKNDTILDNFSHTRSNGPFIDYAVTPSFTLKYYQDSSELFTHLKIDEQLKISFLSQMNKPNELIRFLANARLPKNPNSMKVVMVNKYASKNFNANQLPYSLSTVIEKSRGKEEATHVIVHIEYAFLEIIILEHELTEKLTDEQKKANLYDACTYIEPESNIYAKTFKNFHIVNACYYRSYDHLSDFDLSFAKWAKYSKDINDFIYGFRWKSIYYSDFQAQFHFTLMPISKLKTEYMDWSNFCLDLDYSKSNFQNNLDDTLAKFSNILFDLYRIQTLNEEITKRLTDCFNPLDEFEMNFSEDFLSHRDAISRICGEYETLLIDAKQIIKSYREDKNGPNFKTLVERGETILHKIRLLEDTESKIKEKYDKWIRIMKYLTQIKVKLLDASANEPKKYVFVYDPSVIINPEYNLKWHLGCFSILRANEEADIFFYCSNERFTQLTSEKVRSGKKVQIYFFQNNQVENISEEIPSEKLLESNLKTIKEERNNDSASVRRNSCVTIKNQNQERRTSLQEKINNSEEKPTIPDTNNRSEKPSFQPLPNKEINILLLGESGVGKSTFVNAYYNYLKFNTLDEATKHESLRSLICSTFSYTDNQYNIKTVTIMQNPDQGEGEAEDDDTVDAVANEVFIPGQSSTQHAKSYKFMKDDMLIRIIDTPGIGDSRGVKMDQENFKNTIKYISKLTHLNAICILLKPNIKRMELQTRYCIKELFSHLNKVSIKNLIFCFTNTRSTSFRPGDTLPSLQAFIRDEIEAHSGVKVPLDERNIICVDNEAFRYLTLLKNSENDTYLVKSDQMESHETFVRSWNISKIGSEKLIRYTQSLLELKIKEVVGYNQSRNLSITIVENCLNCLLKLAGDLRNSQIAKNNQLTEEIGDEINSILKEAALITSALRAKSITIFNDHLHAHLEETINKYSSPEFSSTDLGDIFTNFRNKYLEYLEELRNVKYDDEKDLDLEIEKFKKVLHSKLQDRLSKKPERSTTF